MQLVDIAARLRDEVDALTFRAPVTHVLNPLGYAWPLHRAYLERFGSGPKQAVFLGMNPGPWGMAQTGVPFGEVAAVRDWMGLAGAVRRPAHEHPKRPITGLSCPRSEVSGRRLWGWAAQRFGPPEEFFSRFFVLNYCPLLFLEESGRNRTPDKLPAAERAPLEDACDRALREQVAILRPRFVIGVGAWAEKRARAALAGVEVDGEPLRFGRILHPSPASPAANRGWAPQAEAQLVALGLLDE
ncbi:MAG: single-strand selective monofunctional uracil-DNA glycosylase [Deltaproteobacteria bacterium]|nr:MAG: single-strand selective monofunctional uracil-DNA glycosylase [Deltaproteobacteria bacterium]